SASLRIDAGISPLLSASIPSADTITKPSIRRTGGTPMLEVHQITKQRQNADDNDDHAHDLPGPPANRQHDDQIKNEQNDEECNQRSDQDVHASPRLALGELKSFSHEYAIT